MTIIIAGGGVAGLALALTCERIGVDCVVLEAAATPMPLGVGINLQPNAVRELMALGLGDALPRIGVATREYGMFSRFGKEVWAEPRGIEAGYAWPQYSVHRGELQMTLWRAAQERLGPRRVRAGRRVTGYENVVGGVRAHVVGPDGDGAIEGALLVGADGLHSATRARMHPGEGPPKWAGCILWRGATRARPFRTGASMALIGNYARKFVCYPISAPDPKTGEALINWIAEIRTDPGDGWNRESWTREAAKADFAPAFADWRFDWLDVPALIEATGTVYEYPMVDRDPLPFWTDGRATLMGDAAHVMYPTGSNGASQAIVDARKLGRAFLDHGVGPAALAAYEAEMRPATAKTILANRSQGPDYVLQIVEDRCGGRFETIDDVMPLAERAEHAARYKATAGFAVETLNASPPIIPEGARV